MFSLSSQDTENVLAALDNEQDKAKKDAQSEVGVLKEQLVQVEAKTSKTTRCLFSRCFIHRRICRQKTELTFPKGCAYGENHRF